MAPVDKIDRLKSQLLTSGLQQQNNPLYQVINTLIDSTKQLITAVSASVNVDLAAIEAEITALEQANYVTSDDQTALLPNSRELIAGDNITIDDSVPNELTINAPAIVPTETFLTSSDESATLPNSRQLLAGTGIAFDDSTPNERTINATVTPGGDWSVLTNGDPVNPELIFAGGDVIMLYIP